MRELCHVVGFVKLRWVDFVNLVGVYFALLLKSVYILNQYRIAATYFAIVAFDHETAAR